MVVGWNAAPGACGGHQQVPRRGAGMETRHCPHISNHAKRCAPSVPDTAFLMKRHTLILFKVFSFTSKTLFVLKYLVEKVV